MVQEVRYTCKFLEKLGSPQTHPTYVYEDNRTCVEWSEGSVGGSDRAQHIYIREHFVHNAVDQGVLKLRPIASVDNHDVADLLTKQLGANMLGALCKMLMGY